MIYIALLRGINVGGKARVEMSMLKKVFEQLGCSYVQTYINTGNVIFSLEQTHGMKQNIEAAIEKEFNFFVPVVIRDSKNIQALIQKCPPEWQNDTEQKTDVLFLWDEMSNEDILEKLTIKSGIDNVIYTNGAILWNIKRADISKSGLLKIVGTDVYKKMTVRNINTLRKIGGLMK